MHDRTVGRRGVLRSLGATLGAGTGAGGLAGCLSSASESPGTARETTSKRHTEQPRASTSTAEVGGEFPADGRWIPSPGSITNIVAFAVEWWSSEALTYFESSLSTPIRNSFVDPVGGTVSPFGLDVGDVDSLLAFGDPIDAGEASTFYSVVVGTDLDREALVGRLSAAGIIALEEHYEGFDLFQASSRVVGIDDGVLVAGARVGTMGAKATTKRIVDTATGTFPNYYDSVSLYARGRDALGDPHVGRVVTHDPRANSTPEDGVFPEAITDGIGWQFAAETADLTVATLYSRPKHATPDHLRTFASSTPALDPFDYEVTKRDAVVELQGSTAVSSVKRDVPYPPSFADE